MLVYFQFPEALHRVAKSLRNLDLSENKIFEIPAIIGSYAVLKTLLLHANRIGDSLIYCGFFFVFSSQNYLWHFKMLGNP